MTVAAKATWWMFLIIDTVLVRSDGWRPTGRAERDHVEPGMGPVAS
jgi:hypothetical protein